MKTAISLPDQLFAEVERLAQRSGRRRSELYATALREYLARHAPDEVTEGMDRAIAQIGESTTEDQFTGMAARRTRETTEW